MHGFRFHIRAACVWMALLASSATAGQSVRPDSVHLRYNNDRIREVLAWTTDRSPTVRRAVAAIEAADVVVYLEEGQCHDGALRACLQVLPAAGERRLLIRLDTRLPLMSVVAELAHELTHAVEVAGDATALDQPSLRNLYQRIGFRSCDEYARECWETKAAQDNELTAVSEVLRMNTDKPTLPDSAYFGTWTLDISRSAFNGSAPPRESTCIIGDRRYGLISTVTHTVDLDGREENSAYVSRFDGRAYLMSAPGVVPIVTITENTISKALSYFVVESEGRVLATGTRMIHGSEMTVETRVPDGYGQEMTMVMVWKKGDSR